MPGTWNILSICSNYYFPCFMSKKKTQTKTPDCTFEHPFCVFLPCFFSGSAPNYWGLEVEIGPSHIKKGFWEKAHKPCLLKQPAGLLSAQGYLLPHLLLHLSPPALGSGSEPSPLLSNPQMPPLTLRQRLLSTICAVRYSGSQLHVATENLKCS